MDLDTTSVSWCLARGSIHTSAAKHATLHSLHWGRRNAEVRLRLHGENSNRFLDLLHSLILVLLELWPDLGVERCPNIEGSLYEFVAFIEPHLHPLGVRIWPEADDEEAVPLYYEALKINPKFEEGMFNVAFSLFQLGDYDAAEKWINRTSGNPEKKQVFQERIDNARRGE